MTTCSDSYDLKITFNNKFSLLLIKVKVFLLSIITKFFIKSSPKY